MKRHDFLNRKILKLLVNKWLNNKGIQIDTVPYDEISKQGGLFRCSTLPLIRKA